MERSLQKTFRLQILLYLNRSSLKPHYVLILHCISGLYNGGSVKDTSVCVLFLFLLKAPSNIFLSWPPSFTWALSSCPAFITHLSVFAPVQHSYHRHCWLFFSPSSSSSSLINLYSAALPLNQLQRFLSFFLWPCAFTLNPSVPPHPRGCHLKWCFITTLSWPPFSTAAAGLQQSDV